jgi:hypothetical protein
MPAYQSTRPQPGKLYVCEIGVPSISRQLAGPFDSDAEAIAAAGALEAEHLQYQARTEIWICPQPEPDDVAPLLPGFAAQFYGDFSPQASSLQ